MKGVAVSVDQIIVRHERDVSVVRVAVGVAQLVVLFALLLACVASMVAAGVQS